MTSGGALVVALLLQSPASAPAAAPEAASTKARLELRGAADCLSRSDLTARVATRTPRIQFVDDAAIYASVVVTSARPGNVVAELVLATAGAEQPPRRFVARSCAEAADAIALIIAVTLDPTLRRNAVAGATQDRNAGAGGEGGSRVGADSSGGGSSTTAPGTAPASPPAAKPTDQPAADTPPGPPATLDSPTPPAPARAITTGRHYAAYVAGQTIFGPAPVILPGLALYGMAALDRGGVWAPALFVGATRVWRSNLSEPGGTASFTLDAATLDACPLRLGGSRLVARPCVSALVGRLTASGSDTPDPATSARPFAAAGAALTASLGTTVELSARLGIGMTLIRDSYHFGSTTFHRAGGITTTVSVGVGLRWP
jgi:hypothetical protein